MDEPWQSLPDLVLGFEMIIKSRCDELAATSSKVMSLLQTLPCAPQSLDDLYLALLEALTNAVVHGNRQDPAKTIDIRAGCDGLGQLVIAVTDRGDGFDPTALPAPTTSENIRAIHGRGVFLMRHLVDQVEFNLGGRQVVLRKR